MFLFSTPDWSRTSDLLIRSELLYPAELRGQIDSSWQLQFVATIFERDLDYLYIATLFQPSSGFYKDRLVIFLRKQITMNDF